MKKLEDESANESLNEVEELETQIPENYVMSKDELNSMLDNFLESEWEEEELSVGCLPNYMLELEGEVEYFYSLNRKTFVPLRNRSEVSPIDYLPSQEKERYFAFKSEVFIIDPSRVVCIGWN